MSDEDLKAEIERLRAENDKLKNKSGGRGAQPEGQREGLACHCMAWGGFR